MLQSGTDNDVTFTIRTFLLRNTYDDYYYNFTRQIIVHEIVQVLTVVRLEYVPIYTLE